MNVIVEKWGEFFIAKYLLMHQTFVDDDSSYDVTADLVCVNNYYHMDIGEHLVNTSITISLDEILEGKAILEQTKVRLSAIDPTLSCMMFLQIELNGDITDIMVRDSRFPKAVTERRCKLLKNLLEVKENV